VFRIFYLLFDKLKFSGNKYNLALHLVEIDTDLAKDSGRQALDADPDPPK
jgi:hypothetical protein